MFTQNKQLHLRQKASKTNSNVTEEITTTKKVRTSVVSICLFGGEIKTDVQAELWEEFSAVYANQNDRRFVALLAYGHELNAPELSERD